MLRPLHNVRKSAIFFRSSFSRQNLKFKHENSLWSEYSLNLRATYYFSLGSFLVRKFILYPLQSEFSCLNFRFWWENGDRRKIADFRTLCGLAPSTAVPLVSITQTSETMNLIMDVTKHDDYSMECHGCSPAPRSSAGNTVISSIWKSLVKRVKHN